MTTDKLPPLQAYFDDWTPRTRHEVEDYARAAIEADRRLRAVPVPEAMAVVLKAMKDDPEYAWGWHCNIAMAYVDAGGDHAIGNHGAARFLRLLASVEPAHELPPLRAVPGDMVPKGYKLIQDKAYGQRYVSLVGPDDKIIVNAYEQGFPQMFAFLSAIAAAPTAAAPAGGADGEAL